MRLLDAPRAGLALLGRYGAQTFALSLILGFAFPWLAGPAKPLLPVTIFCFITINMMRADLPELRRLARRPERIALAVALSTLLPFLIIGALVALAGRDAFSPGLLLGLAIAAAAPPLVAAPAYALLFGLSNALSLTVLVLSMTLSPLIAPAMAGAVAGAAVPIDRLALTIRLAVFLFGAMAIGLAARRLAGPAWLSRHKSELDGAGVVIFFVFAIAITEAVTTALWATPWRVALYAALAFGACIASFLLTFLAWRRVDRGEAVTLALATGLRNTGLLISVMGVTSVPEDTFLFFALMQFPIYFAPQIVKPFVGWMLGPERSVAGRAP